MNDKSQDKEPRGGTGEQDPFSRYYSVAGGPELERLDRGWEIDSAGLCAQRLDALSRRAEAVDGACKDCVSEALGPAEESARFDAKAAALLKEANDYARVNLGYLAPTRPGVLGIPKRLLLRAVRYPVKTYTDGIFSSQEHFNSATASFLNQSADELRTLLSQTAFFDKKLRLQQRFDDQTAAALRAAADNISALCEALQRQRSFNRSLASFLDGFVKASAELVASVRDALDERLAKCERRLDQAEEAIRSANRESEARFREAQKSDERLLEALNEVSEGLSKRLARAEQRLDGQAGRAEALERRADEAEQRIAGLDGRSHSIEKRLDAAEGALGGLSLRQDRAEDAISSLDNRQLAFEKRADEAEEAIRSGNARFEAIERELEGVSKRVEAVGEEIHDTHSFFSLQLEATDARIEHAEVRHNELAEWVGTVQSKVDAASEWLANQGKQMEAVNQWLANQSNELESARQWLKNLSETSEEHGRWLQTLQEKADEQTKWAAGVSDELAGHTEWLNNLQTAHKEQSSWLFSLSQRFEELGQWVGNLEKGQKETSSSVQSVAKRIKEIGYSVGYVKRKLASAPSAESQAPGSPSSVARAPVLEDDEYLIFEERFRGDSEDIKRRQKRYVDYFGGCRRVVDLGCGRGEFLELLREGGIEGLGVDLSPGMVQICKEKGLRARRSDVLSFLERARPGQFDGAFCSQVLEHLGPAEVFRVCKLLSEKIAPGGVVVLETINPCSVYAFLNSFLLDPSHTFPLHPQMLQFALSLTELEVEKLLYLAPVDEKLRPKRLESASDAASLSNQVARLLDQNFVVVDEILFGSQDYAVVARKPR